MNYKNLTTTILGIVIMILGCVCFFTTLLVEFSVIKFIVAEVLGVILFRCWMSKDKTLKILERFIK